MRLAERQRQPPPVTSLFYPDGPNRPRAKRAAAPLAPKRQHYTDPQASHSDSAPAAAPEEGVGAVVVEASTQRLVATPEIERDAAGARRLVTDTLPPSSALSSDIYRRPQHLAPSHLCQTLTTATSSLQPIVQKAERPSTRVEKLELGALYSPVTPRQDGSVDVAEDDFQHLIIVGSSGNAFLSEAINKATVDSPSLAANIQLPVATPAATTSAATAAVAGVEGRCYPPSPSPHRPTTNARGEAVNDVVAASAVTAGNEKSDAEWTAAAIDSPRAAAAVGPATPNGSTAATTTASAAITNKSNGDASASPVASPAVAEKRRGPTQQQPQCIAEANPGVSIGEVVPLREKRERPPSSESLKAAADRPAPPSTSVPTIKKISFPSSSSAPSAAADPQRCGDSAVVDAAEAAASCEVAKQRLQLPALLPAVLALEQPTISSTSKKAASILVAAADDVAQTRQLSESGASSVNRGGADPASNRAEKTGQVALPLPSGHPTDRSGQAQGATEGQVVEQAEPTWTVLQPLPEESRSRGLLNQVQFVAQMSNITAI